MKTKKYILDLQVREIKQLNERNILLRLTDKTSLPKMLPGQFVEVKVENSPATFLRRPISINFVDRDNNELWILVSMIGDGTRQLGKLSQGDFLNCVLPLGNGFTIPTVQKADILLVGGGVGVAPLLYFGKVAKERGANVTYLLGAKTVTDILLLDEFSKYGKVYTTTEDGSYGEKGFVTSHSLLSTKKFDTIYTCGPKPMMKAVVKYARKVDTNCEVSLENNMACGLGACLCCVEKTIDGNICVCSDGPVFNMNQLLW